MAKQHVQFTQQSTMADNPLLLSEDTLFDLGWSRPLSTTQAATPFAQGDALRQQVEVSGLSTFCPSWHA